MVEVQDELGGWLAERGIPAIVLSFAPPARLRPYAAEKRWPFPLYADPDRTAYGAFRLRRMSWWRVLSPLIWPKYLKILLQRGGLRRPDPGDDIYQGGGDFIVLPDGAVPYAHRSDDPVDRPTPAELQAALAAALAGGRQDAGNDN